MTMETTNAVAVAKNGPAAFSFGEIQQLAQAVVAGGLFGVKTQEQALSLMLLAQAEGIHPMIAARDYNIIDGKPALKADAMLARYQHSGGKISWKEMNDTCVIGVFSHPAGGTVTIDWTMERARVAGLGGKAMWTKYPRQMLRARVISEGIRATFPSGIVGVHTPEEVMDFDIDNDPNKYAATTRKQAPIQQEWISEAEVIKKAEASICGAPSGQVAMVIEVTEDKESGASVTQEARTEKEEKPATPDVIIEVKPEESYDPFDSVPATPAPTVTAGPAVKLYLNVPFQQKDEVKTLGARFDMDAKKWYHLSDVDAKPFAKWATTPTPAQKTLAKQTKELLGIDTTSEYN